MIGTIYALAEPDTQNVRYCGKTIKQMPIRMDGHRRDAYTKFHRHSCNWLREVYEAGEEPVIMVCEEIDLADLPRTEQLRLLNEAETRWIYQLKALGFDLTNATNGGDGCHGRVVSDETRKKAANSNRGQKRSAETCKRIQEACINRDRSNHVRGEAHPFFGKIPWADPQARAAKLRGANNPNASLSNVQVLAIYYDDLGTYKEIATRHNTTPKIVGDIKTGKSWSSVTHHDPKTYQKIRAVRRSVYK